MSNYSTAITEKQERCIWFINRTLGAMYVPKNKAEASKFISEHIENASQTFRNRTSPDGIHEQECRKNTMERIAQDKKDYPSEYHEFDSYLTWHKL